MARLTMLRLRGRLSALDGMLVLFLAAHVGIIDLDRTTEVRLATYKPVHVTLKPIHARGGMPPPVQDQACHSDSNARLPFRQGIPDRANPASSRDLEIQVSGFPGRRILTALDLSVTPRRICVNFISRETPPGLKPSAVCLPDQTRAFRA